MAQPSGVNNRQSWLKQQTLVEQFNQRLHVWRRQWDSNPWIAVLQTTALPLGYVANRRDYTIASISLQE